MTRAESSRRAGARDATIATTAPCRVRCSAGGARSTVTSKPSWLSGHIIASPNSGLVWAFEKNHAVIWSVRPKQAHVLDGQLLNLVSESCQVLDGASLVGKQCRHRPLELGHRPNDVVSVTDQSSVRLALAADLNTNCLAPDGGTTLPPLGIAGKSQLTQYRIGDSARRIGSGATEKLFDEREPVRWSSSLTQSYPAGANLTRVRVERVVSAREWGSA